MNWDFLVALTFHKLAIDVHLCGWLHTRNVEMVLWVCGWTFAGGLTAAVDMARHPCARAMAPPAPAWRAMELNMVTEEKKLDAVLCCFYKSELNLLPLRRSH